MNSDSIIRRVFNVARRECGIMKTNPVYLLCMVIFPVLVTIFFTSLMGNGQPVDMPVGVVDLDNTSTTRTLTRRLDAFQTTRVADYYNSVAEARRAVQRNEIYAFIYFPKGTTQELLSSRRPKISFYYSSASLTAGALLFRDLKTISMLGSAAVGSSVLTAKGATPQQVKTFLQPIMVDLHTVNNPAVNYSVYLNTMLIPGCLMLFIFLIVPYSVNTELKFGTSREWIRTAGGNIWVAVAGKTIPQTMVFLAVTYGYMYYVFGILDFPHPGGTGMIILAGALLVFAAQGFGLFMAGLIPSLRMSLSTCSLWAVLSFSLVGTAFPVTAMDGELQAIAWLFPLRHYYMVYQLNIFNGYALYYSWIHVACMAGFALLPLTVMGRLKKSMLNYEYMP